MATAAPPDDDLLRTRAWYLLGSGSVRVRHVDRTGRVDAIVQGRTGLYHVQRSPGGEWTCTCEAADRGLRCSHRGAVQLVTGEGG